MEKLWQVAQGVLATRFNTTESLCAATGALGKAPEISKILGTIGEAGLVDKLGYSPATYALMADDPVQLRKFIALGYRPSDREGSWLHEAAFWNSIRSAEYLLDHGANPDGNIHEKGGTPLMVAVSEGGPDVARLLLARGAHVDTTTIRYALVCRDQAMVDLLVSTGAHLDSKTRAVAEKLHMNLPSDGR